MEYQVIDGPHEGMKVHTPGKAGLKVLKVPFENGRFVAVYEMHSEGLALAEVEPAGV
jgi:hypothetical protein